MRVGEIKAVSRALVAVTLLACVATSVQGDDRLGGLLRGLKRTLRGGKELAVEQKRPSGCTHPNVEELAGQIDWLEHHLELYGSATAKQPNIWGEARLTRHRQEIETELAAKISDFERTFQAALSRADAAAAALNLSINEPTETGAASASASASAVTSQALTLEPGLENQQLFRYLNSLNTLRRINEGDDTADAPGYAMNLLRVPVSILPGKRTRQGYGAEITMTLHPQMDQNLLPKTFRSLVVNDQVDQLSLSMVRLIEGERSTRERGIDGLRDYAEAEHLAQPTIDLFLARIQAIEWEAPGNAFCQRVRNIQEYLRNRIIQIHQLAASDSRSATFLERSFPAFDLEVRVSVPYKRLKRLFVPLLEKGFGLLTLDVEITSKGQPQGTLPITILIAEVADFSKLSSASLPYGFWIPLGPWTGDMRSFNQRVRQNQGDLVCEVNRIGMQHLEWIATLINENPDFLPVGEEGESQLLTVLSFLLKEIEQTDGFSPLPIADKNLALLVDLVAHGCTAEVPACNPPEELKAPPLSASLNIASPMQFVSSRPEANSCDLYPMLGPQTRKLILKSVTETVQENVEREIKALVEFATKLSTWAAKTIAGQASTEDKAPKSAPQSPQESTVQDSLLMEKIVELWNGAVKQNHSVYELYNGGVSENIASNERMGTVFDFNTSGIVPGFAFGSSSALRSRKATHPLSPAMQNEVYGSMNLSIIARALDEALRHSPPNEGSGRLLIDVRTYLTDELQAAYELLSQQRLLHCWQFGCVELADAIQGQDWASVRSFRREYERRLPPGIAGSIAGALGWGLMVESSLLNELLINDIRAHAEKNGMDCPDVSGFCFWGPEPPAESRDVFNQYVMQRWPIQVFALDPITQDQNVNDAYSVARDLQISIAAAAQGGQVPIGIASSFARNLQLELDSIAINRTAVGFSHGASTFGWRFYPRVQSPATPGTLGALGQTIFGGPTRDTLIRQRRLEPGMRECVAMVIMPSFIEDISVTSRSSWFHLMNPADKELTVTDAMQLSSAQQAIQNFLNCIRDCNCYRAGDVAHLSDVVGQLEQRLPLQSTSVQVPYENSLGGYELLQSGVTGLAPDLVGWYGAPGIDPANPTKLFLVGQGFSVHQTRVIAGGREVAYKLVSREIMEVTVPPGTQPLQSSVTNADRTSIHENSVDFHVATPYGVSSHLLVPVVQPEAVVRTPTWNPGALQLELIVKQPTTDAGSITAERIGVNPPMVVGVEVPMNGLGSAGKLSLDVYAGSEAGLVRVGSQAVSLDVGLDSANNRYIVQPFAIQGLLTQIQTFVLTEANAKRLGTDNNRIRFVAQGTVQVPDNGVTHKIAGVLPIDVRLIWK